MSEEEQRLQEYLAQYADSGSAVATWKAWKQLNSALTDLIMPNACAAQDGHILLTWDCTDLHVELELFPDGKGEFLSWNRPTNEWWDTNWTIGTPIPSDAIAYLRPFCTHD